MGKDGKDIKIVAYTAVLIIALTASQCFAADICSLGSEVLLLPDAGQEEFFKENIKGKILEGTGYVVNTWKRGPDKNYAVSVDCGNDVVVNVAVSADIKNMKAGQLIDFTGTCVAFGSRRHIYSKKIYMVFELHKGSVEARPEK
jgi:hypothetical protein